MKHQCPLCKSELKESAGEKMHPNDPEYGVTLWCGGGSCPAQEVMGHGRNVKEAFEVITAKYTRK